MARPGLREVERLDRDGALRSPVGRERPADRVLGRDVRDRAAAAVVEHAFEEVRERAVGCDRHGTPAERQAPRPAIAGVRAVDDGGRRKVRDQEAVRRSRDADTRALLRVPAVLPTLHRDSGWRRRRRRRRWLGRGRGRRDDRIGGESCDPLAVCRDLLPHLRDHLVDAAPAGEAIASGPTVEVVVAGEPDERVVAGLAVHAIGARRPTQHVVSGRPDAVRGRGARDHDGRHGDDHDDAHAPHGNHRPPLTAGCQSAAKGVRRWPRGRR